MLHLFALLLGTAMLDTDMTDQDKRNTGVYKLTDKEKGALQDWIDAKYQNTPPTPPPTTAVVPMKPAQPTLSENIQNSQYLRLSDGTMYNVRPEDVPIAQGWITPVEIIVTQSSNPFYTYKLTNQVSGSSILARKVERIPGAATPTPLPVSPAAPIKSSGAAPK